MPSTNGRLKIAVQKEGRISDDSFALLKAMGFDFEVRSRTLYSPCRNFPLDILSVRDDDIPEFVQDGVSDCGIVGDNIRVERESRVDVVERLGFGKCRLAICAPRSGRVKSIATLSGARIATSYPRTVARFLEANGIEASVVEISGSVEITPVRYHFDRQHRPAERPGRHSHGDDLGSRVDCEPPHLQVAGEKKRHRPVSPPTSERSSGAE